MKITIDGREVQAEPGESVLACALRNGIDIPHLCTHPALPAFGACRLCIVEVAGLRGFPTSCTTPAQEGMVVRTDTEALRDLRRAVLELILVEHPSACLVCGKSELCEQYRPKAERAGRTTGCHTCNNKEVCEVRVISHDLGVKSLPYPPFYRNLPVARGDPFFDRDVNLCILCGRCVRICSHMHTTATIEFVGRGSRTHVAPAFGRSMVAAGCRFCGSCVDVCPTGCLADRFAKWHGAPETVVETTCTFCEAGCAVKVSADRARAFEARAVDPHTPLCVLGRFGLAPFLGGPTRLGAPRVRVGKALREVEWPAAVAAAAEKLKPFAGEAFALVCDGSSTLEDRHVFRRFTSEVMRSPHYIELAAGDARPAAALPPGVRAALLTGSFLAPADAERLDALVLADCYPGPLEARAAAVLPAAIAAEVDGTVADATGARRPLRQACRPPGQARPDWRIVADLAAALGGAGFAYGSVEAVAAEVGGPPAALLARREAPAPAAAHDPRLRRTHFRGHRLDEKVGGLKHVPLCDARSAEGEDDRGARSATASASRSESGANVHV